MLDLSVWKTLTVEEKIKQINATHQICDRVITSLVFGLKQYAIVS